MFLFSKIYFRLICSCHPYVEFSLLTELRACEVRTRLTQMDRTKIGVCKAFYKMVMKKPCLTPWK